jgi:signal transduction histidine kinase
MAAQTGSDFSTGDILVVDDEAANLQLLNELLSGAGFRVRHAGKPRLAIDSAFACPPDVILLDVRMPEMDGFEVCRRLKQDERTRDVPIIFVSALQVTADRVRGLDLGGVDFISKPFQETEILARVRTHMALRKMNVYLEDLVAERAAGLTAKNRFLNAEIEERARAEAALAESRRFSDRLIETANVMIVEILSFGVDVTERRQQEARLTDYQQRLKALASELTITEERERRRIAEELHAGPVQLLAFAHMRLAAARKEADASKRDRALEEVSGILRQATLDTSGTVSDLSSPALKELGLTAAISDWLEAQIQDRFGLATTVISHLEEAEAPDMDDLTRAILFRNVRELLANVVKHSQASKVGIILERNGENLELTVSDDGKACDPDTVVFGGSSEGGFGLFSIRERMADPGGALEIASEPGQGFVAKLVMPLGVDG